MVSHAYDDYEWMRDEQVYLEAKYQSPESRAIEIEVDNEPTLAICHMRRRVER